MRKFCRHYNFEIQFFRTLWAAGVIKAIRNENNSVLVHSEEFEKLHEKKHYVSCPVCDKKMGIITKKHYKECCPSDGSVQPLYSEFYLNRRKKSEKQKKAQSQKLKKRFKTPDGEITRMTRTVQERRRSSRKNDLRSAFFRGELEVKSMDSEGRVVWRPLKDVCRHNVSRKQMLRVITDTGSVDVTEDHSLFCWGNREPIETKILAIGDRVVCCKENIIEPATISSVEKIEKHTHAYDVSVPGTESAFLKSGILVHNSYTISGVSLDVEKSGKYESMKNNFIQEYDKLKEQAKRSIKIIKGLKQPRYGIGISSALGPLSSPGVQSRRNWVSGNYS